MIQFHILFKAQNPFNSRSETTFNISIAKCILAHQDFSFCRSSLSYIRIKDLYYHSNLFWT